MSSDRRVVCDNNVVVSAMLLPSSVAAKVYARLCVEAEILTSRATLAELIHVVHRSKFERYLSLAQRTEFVELYELASIQVQVTRTVTDCRDPKDNKFLELALSGKADLILTGDDDLLTLHPWGGIAILSPANYLALT